MTSGAPPPDIHPLNTSQDRPRHSWHATPSTGQRAKPTRTIALQTVYPPGLATNQSPEGGGSSLLRHSGILAASGASCVRFSSLNPPSCGLPFLQDEGLISQLEYTAGLNMPGDEEMRNGE